MPAYEPRDSAYREARRLGYRSRAALKLIELDRKFSLFRPSQSVVDLGCWPGGWLQVAAERTGGRGRVVGIDLKEVDDLGLDNVVTLVGDMNDADLRSLLCRAVGGPADVVLSDMAPKLSGIRVADQARGQALVELAVDVADGLLAAGGNLLVKVFSNSQVQATELLRKRYSKVLTFRPASSRKGSAEIYMLGRGLKEEAGGLRNGRACVPS